MTALLDTIAMAFATLRGNVLRSALTLLGIVIGVAAEASVKSGLVVDIASLLKEHGVNPAEIGMA